MHTRGKAQAGTGCASRAKIHRYTMARIVLHWSAAAPPKNEQRNDLINCVKSGLGITLSDVG